MGRAGVSDGQRGFFAGHRMARSFTASDGSQARRTAAKQQQMDERLRRNSTISLTTAHDQGCFWASSRVLPECNIRMRACRFTPGQADCVRVGIGSGFRV